MRIRLNKLKCNVSDLYLATEYDKNIEGQKIFITQRKFKLLVFSYLSNMFMYVQITANFSAPEGRAGDDVTLNVHTSLQSTVFMMAIDRSIELLENLDYITEEDVSLVLFRIEKFSTSCIINFFYI